MTPYGIRAFLASNLDYTGTLIRDRIALEGARVLLIPNATYAEGRTLKPDQQEAYEACGASVGILDLTTPSSIKDTMDAIASTDVLHLCGGNTFALLAAMQACSFHNALLWHAQRRGVTVVGESAGAVVLGEDIAHIAPLDEPSAAPHLRGTTGLGFVPDLLVPHYKAEAWGFGDRIDTWLDQDPQSTAYTLLRDNEAIFVHNDTRLMLRA